MIDQVVDGSDGRSGCCRRGGGWAEDDRDGGREAGGGEDEDELVGDDGRGGLGAGLPWRVEGEGLEDALGKLGDLVELNEGSS